MPCWYFEKKEIKNTPSYKDGIDSFTESRYRREGARFIIDAGTKMGLRYDTCATGVVYFHRFYMFHSFKEFHRYITAACCLFLAGKVEETPKKCKDIIKICQNLLSPTLFTVFGNDPKEEVMTMERILLQTIKFDLQVEHPYSALLKFAKIIKGDKDKIQKLVQMAWTFINDSLCTTLCLQWEPEITAVSLMYLATRLTKFDIQDWTGKTPGTKLKWWESLVEDMTVDLMEDICHKVLDLYSNNPPIREDSPPTTPSKKGGARDTPPPPPPAKRSGPNTPADGAPESKVQRSESQTRKDTPNRGASSSSGSKSQAASQSSSSLHHSSAEGGKSKSQSSSHGQNTSSSQPPFSKTEQSGVNPYMSSQMFSSSFMSQEGSKSIQTLMGGGQEGVAAANPPPSADVYGNMAAIPPTQPPPTMGQYPTQTGQYTNPQYPQGMYAQASAAAQYPQQPAYGAQPTQPGYPSVASQPYQATSSIPAAPVPTQGYPQASYPQNYPQQPQMQPYMQQYQPPPQIPTTGYSQVPQQPTYNQGAVQPSQQHYQQQQQQHLLPNPRIPLNSPARGPRPQAQPNQPQAASTNSGLTVRISGRR